MSIRLKLIMLINEQVVSGLLYIHGELGLTHNALDCSTILLDLDGRVKIDKVQSETGRGRLLMCQANIGDSLIEKRQLNPDSKRNDIRSLEAIIMKLMKPTTYILDAQSTKLKNSDKWKNSLKVEDFLAATQHKSLQELKQISSLIDLDLGMCSDTNKHKFLPQEPLETCLASHVFCAVRAARLGD